jgi:hypothetical protein
MKLGSIIILPAPKLSTTAWVPNDDKIHNMYIYVYMYINMYIYIYIKIYL